MGFIKRILKYISGYDNEYTKREMAIFTRVCLVLLLFSLPMFGVLVYANLKLGLTYKMSEMLFQSYMKFCGLLITAYSVAWLGQMGKAYLSKKNEEEIKREKNVIEKLRKEIKSLKGE